MKKSRAALNDLIVGLPDSEFRQVGGFPRYFVGNCGSVVSTIRAGRVLRQTLLNVGYPYVSLMRQGASKPTKATVHRLVATAFVANPHCHPTVNHMDGCKINNRAENLEWCTYAHNNNHARTSGLSNAFGEKHYAAKLTTADVAEIRRLLATGMLHRMVAVLFGVGRKHITKIANNQVRIVA